MIRYLLGIACLMFILPSSADVCLDGNIEVQPLYCFDEPGGCPVDEVLCCVAVGDGSAYSCTDGKTWRCFGNCAE